MAGKYRAENNKQPGTSPLLPANGFPFNEASMTAIELHRMAMDTQDHIERVADMWFSYLKFAIPCLVCYCLGWTVARVSEYPR